MRAAAIVFEVDAKVEVVLAMCLLPTKIFHRNSFNHLNSLVIPEGLEPPT
jgi:hypothetical protein